MTWSICILVLVNIFNSWLAVRYWRKYQALRYPNPYATIDKHIEEINALVREKQ